MERFPLEIPVFSHMRDHAFDGQVMFCAAELLHFLAAAVTSRFPDLDAADQVDALFPRFLLLPSEGKNSLPVLLELENKAGEGVTVHLLREFHSRSGKLSRLRKHVRARFLKKRSSEFPLLSFAAAKTLPGIPFEISAESIYEGLIPFAPAYRNIRGHLRMNVQGAIALLRTRMESFPGRFPGFPLIFDAALQAACVWGQRYQGRVVFPVGFSRRYFWKRTKSEIPYLCRVLPVGAEGDVLIFDLWIYDLEGTLHEAVTGLRMADVTAGRIQPPRWIQEPFP